MADQAQAQADEEQRQREMDKARRDRATNMRLVRAAIAWMATPAYGQLTYHQLTERLQRLRNSLDVVTKINEKLADGIDNDNDRNALYDEYALFEGECLDAIGTMNQRLQELAPPAAAAAPPAQNINVTMPFRPEAIQNTWGSFNGDQMTWYDWKAKFTMAVHDVPVAQMPTKNKLQFLLSALTDEGMNTISKFELVPENYAQIWAALTDRYEKRYPTACAYLSKFFALPHLDNRATAADLRNMVNTTNELLRQIRTVNYPIQHWDLIIVHALHQRLNKQQRAEWERVRDGKEEPTADDMTKALLQIASLAENQGLTYEPSTRTTNHERASINASVQSRLGPSVQSRLQPSTSTGSPRNACAFCMSLAHRTVLCPQFVVKPIAERKQMVYGARLCVWCLKGGHFKHECYSGKPCNESTCQADAKHHASICAAKERRGPYDHAAPVAYRPGSSRSSASNLNDNRAQNANDHGHGNNRNSS